jgi:hypothetical protein
MSKIKDGNVMIVARVSQEDVDAIERWRGTRRINGKIPPRSQVFMALLKLGMEASSKREGATK